MNSARQVVNEFPRPPDISDALLARIRTRLPVVEDTLYRYGRAPLQIYVDQSIGTAASRYQSHDDLCQVAYRHSAPLLGDSIGRRVAAELFECPVVLTANHHGVDFFAQSVQSTLLFSLRRKHFGTHATTVPVLACGSVPLNNVTYPRGALLYTTNPNVTGEFPLRLPIFPDRLKRQMVSLAPGFDEILMQRAEERATRLSRDEAVSQETVAVLREILQRDYCAPETLCLHSYSEQVVQVNARLWQRLFTDRAEGVPDLVYLELERLARALLEHDLTNRESLVFAMAFNAPLRNGLLAALDGASACWRWQELVHRCTDRRASGWPSTASGCGTFMFWGIDDAGRRVPLVPDDSGGKYDMLRGVDDRGRMWAIPLAPEAVLHALREGRLLPSLFTCFLAIAFARGITCLGGYYQAAYLPMMQRGVVATLLKHGRMVAVAKHVARVPTRGYLSGMQAVMGRTPGGGLVPAGPVEIAARGGISNDEIEQIRSLTVWDAHLASMSETITDVVPDAVGSPDWRLRLAEEHGWVLQDKVVVC